MTSGSEGWPPCKDSRIRAVARYEPVDPSDTDHVQAAAEANAKIEADRVASEAWRARLAADAPLPKVHLRTRTGRVEAIVRLDGDRLYTRLPGAIREASWTRDGDVWRCDRFNGQLELSCETVRHIAGGAP